MGAGGHDPDVDIEIWEKRPDEPGRAYAVFVEFLEAKSLREAVARARKQDGREPAARVPGHLLRMAKEWRWIERKNAFLAHRAEKEAALFEELRLARRRRRLLQLGKAGDLIGERLEKMQSKDIKPARLFAELERVHGLEREELGESSERAGEHHPGDLPSIDDRIRPPEPHDEM